MQKTPADEAGVFAEEVSISEANAQMPILAKRFGRKLTLPPTIQIKRQILLRWLEDQTEEAANVQEGPHFY